jgi:hypothetical protein
MFLLIFDYITQSFVLYAAYMRASARARVTSVVSKLSPNHVRRESEQILGVCMYDKVTRRSSVFLSIQKRSFPKESVGAYGVQDTSATCRKAPGEKQ